MTPILTQALLGVALLGALSPALAARPTVAVTEQVELAAPPATTWAVVRDFDGLHKWHPAFASTEIIKGRNNVKGALRVLTTKDGAKLTEQLLTHSDKSMSMKYRITESPFPIRNYVSTVKVTASKGGGSIVTWSSTFKGKDEKPKEGEDDASLKKLVSGVYTTGFDNLKTFVK
jgi:hypothetical protein